MAEILLFHHAQGQTQGFLDFDAELRRAGHTVHTPDPFESRSFDTMGEGMAFVEEGELEAAHALVASAEKAELFQTPAISTISPAPACRRTTRLPLPYGSSACSAFLTGADLGIPPAG